MPPSQLKRLKTSLREQGVTGPQKSKKQKQQERKGTTDSRVQRNAALQQIRDSFNPFEIKANNRPAKFQSLTAHPKKDAVLRPGVTRSMGEEAVSAVAFALKDQRLTLYSVALPCCPRSSAATKLAESSTDVSAKTTRP
jgi:hypothetical protein